jgi:peptidase M23-like protein
VRSTDPYAGRFSTERLVAAAEVLRTAGWSEDSIRRRVYAPFIVAGPASWSDSWGAPRFGPGPTIRTHEGQDVLCEYGAEVLAPEDGIVDYGTGLLGGRVARLHRPGGGYWFYAHLSGWNIDAFPSGSPVRAGDVIGYCGVTGNATTPHVHFGHYDADGDAIDPMASLVSWLRQAELDLVDLLGSSSGTLPDVSPAAVGTTGWRPPVSSPAGRVEISRRIVTGRLGRGDGARGAPGGALELALVWGAGVAFAFARSVAGRAMARAAARRKRGVNMDSTLRRAPAVVIHVPRRAVLM